MEIKDKKQIEIILDALTDYKKTHELIKCHSHSTTAKAAVQGYINRVDELIILVDAEIWVYRVGEIVMLSIVDALIEEGLPADAKFEIIAREKDEEENQYYTVKSLDNGSIWDSLGAVDIIDIETGGTR
jgi:hypothetical protein